MPITTCERCGRDLERLSNPIARLGWTRYWWRGAISLVTGPLWLCGACGAIYSTDGVLLGAGAIATDAEQKLDAYRRDMAHVRDAFAGVVIAAEVVVAWLVFGPHAGSALQLLVAAGAGAGALVPFWYFARKARLAKRDLKELKSLRRGSTLPAD